MARDGRSEAQKAKDREAISELYFRTDGGKMTQAAIAEKLNISQATVSRDVTYLRRQWQREAKRKVEVGQGDALARYREIYGEAWNAYEQSKESKVVADGIDRDGETNLTTTSTQAGNASYLRLALQAVDSEVKLLGLQNADKAIPIDPMILLQLQIHGYSLQDIAQAFLETAQLALQQEATGIPLVVDAE